MPTYKDNKTGLWYCKFYYTDYTGQKKQKLKRGFKLQREAKDWERDFLLSKQLDINIPFENFVNIYFDDIKPRIREYTFQKKSYMIKNKIIPFFGNMILSDITPATVRKWQNGLITYKDSTGKGYSETYLRTLHGQLSSIFNFACKYYGLKENPCQKAGCIGSWKSNEMSIWTLDQFHSFIKAVSDKPMSRAGFLILYYTGMRIGELLALEVCDIDMEEGKISITKSCQRIQGNVVITPPKTPKSNRTVSIPMNLCKEIQEYINKLYKASKHERLFKFSRGYFEKEIKRGANIAGLKPIRLHDMRHSHASLLIELGFAPLVIADRLGHEDVSTTLNIYSHLFPNKRDEVAEKLESCFLVSN